MRHKVKQPMMDAGKYGWHPVMGQWHVLYDSAADFYE